MTPKGHAFTTKENSRSLRVFVRTALDRTAPDRIDSRLHRARDASKLKSSLKAVRGSRKAEGGKSAGTMDESVTGSVNPFQGSEASFLGIVEKSARFLRSKPVLKWIKPVLAFNN